MGAPFDAATIRAVWNRGATVFGLDPRLWRRDSFSRLIHFNDFGNEESDHGWHIDHIRPVSVGGFDGLQNLQPLHWKANLEKGDSFPVEFQSKLLEHVVFS